MNCRCAERKPCPIHGALPLRMPEIRQIATFVVKLYDKWNGTGWDCFATVSKDAIRVFESKVGPTKQEALDECKDYLK